ncbi:MAG: AI-2E family transporter [Rhodocyclaceae bacterium]|nr:AI-2E family transporter [Rhodocyclaceae bacterium]
MKLHRPDRLQTVAWAGVGAALLGLFYLLAPILTPFAVAAVFAYICDPAVNWMTARRIPRAAAVLLVILGLGMLLSLVVLILAPMIYREAVLLIARLPELIELADARLAPLLQSTFGIEFRLDAASFKSWVAEHGQSAKDLLPVLLSHAREGGMALVSAVATLALIPIVMFYLLQEWPNIVQALRDTIPRPMLASTTRVLGNIDSVLSEFLRGQLSVMLILAAYYSLGLWIAGLKFALPVGVLTGLLAFIPFVGFGGGLLLAVLAALLQAEGWSPLLGVGIVFGIGQLLESYVLTPYLVGERIGLHPLAVIFALMAFGQLFGFVGMLVALPASAAILVGWRELREAWFASPVYLGQPPSDPDDAQR